MIRYPHYSAIASVGYRICGEYGDSTEKDTFIEFPVWSLITIILPLVLHIPFANGRIVF